MAPGWWKVGFPGASENLGTHVLNPRVQLHGSRETTGGGGKAKKCLGIQPARGCANGKFLLCVRGPPGPGDSQPSQTRRPHRMFRQHFPALAGVRPGPYPHSTWEGGERCGVLTEAWDSCVSMSEQRLRSGGGNFKRKRDQGSSQGRLGSISVTGE